MSGEAKFAGCLLLGFVSLAAVCSLLRPGQGSALYRFPKGFRGRAVVVYGEAGGVPLPQKDGVYVYEFPSSGRLVISDSYDVVANRWFSDSAEFMDGTPLPLAMAAQDQPAEPEGELRFYLGPVESTSGNTVYKVFYFVGTPNEYGRMGEWSDRIKPK